MCDNFKCIPSYCYFAHYGNIICIRLRIKCYLSHVLPFFRSFFRNVFYQKVIEYFKFSLKLSIFETKFATRTEISVQILEHFCNKILIYAQ